jgi:hypothetical protein
MGMAGVGDGWAMREAYTGKGEDTGRSRGKSRGERRGESRGESKARASSENTLL